MKTATSRGQQPGLRSVAGAACLALLAAAAPAHGEPEPGSPEALARVGASLERGAFSEAIDRLEQWSDQGKLHRDLSFNRGLAYLRRAESSARRTGDLEQASAAFQEALVLDPSDDEARAATERVLEELSRERARRKDRRVVVRPRLLRAVLGLVGENAWAMLAALGSLLTSFGLWLRWLERTETRRVTSNVLVGTGLLLLSLGGSLAAYGAYARRNYAPAVVVAAEARLLDPAGRPLTRDRGPSAGGEAGDRVPGGSLVYVYEVRGALARVEWGDQRAWVNRSRLRPLGGGLQRALGERAGGTRAPAGD